MQNHKTYTLEQAKHILEKYCVYQDRCHQEVQQKLYKMNMISDAQELIMVHLIQHNFLNEERFAKSFVRGKFYYKNWGKIKIKMHLKAKNINDTIIKTALTEINEEDYLQTLKQLATKKVNQILAKNEFEKRKKATYFLQAKGYELSLIISELNKIFKN